MKDFLLELSTVSFVIFIFIVYVSIFFTPFEEETKLFSKDYWRDVLAKNIMLIAGLMVCLGFLRVMRFFVDYYIPVK